ncbi:MAG: 30S ribosome-binding factor RbfA [Firmicutes bacterium]|nr:30S ribosome-binding factor RbfA [Bacillota bacterium]
MSIKLQRTNSDITRVLQVALTQKLGNPALVNVNILNVETAADLSTCRVFVDIRHDNPAEILAQLESSAGFLRNEIANNVKIRRAPAVRFIHDQGRANAERVEELLSKIHSE